ncbi:TolC family protein [Thalassomonas actiniarum]|uniref:TolC family protein n=1 Tax=Thalassomonas actiniarum TaxID=485447 RepID=A0AAE9YS06_9GAMM|nr:TolC family protein [Thalassomonas actiniarum]WDD99228.1 TolC family protein [Thalassomonas actiniarum]
MKFHKKTTLALLLAGALVPAYGTASASALDSRTAQAFSSAEKGGQSQVSWGLWLQQQIEQHPDIIAAQAAVNARLSMADGKDKRLYNPELATEFEQEGANDNFTLAINQTIDWWDKRSVRMKQGDYDRLAAGQEYKQLLQEKTAEVLHSLVKWQSVNALAELARSQENQLNTLLNLVEQRQESGDLSQVDAELAYLSLSQKLNTTAQAQAQLQRVEAGLRQLLPGWNAASGQIPERFWSLGDVNNPVNLDNHPGILAAKARWQALKQQAVIARLETKADPTFGLSAGKSGGDDVVALSFSMPLNINNDFSNEARAANQEAASVEALYRSVIRKQQFSLQASQAVFLEYQKKYQRWLDVMQGRAERTSRLLAAQWQSGDISTSEYLLALQQRSEGLQAGIELRTAYQGAKIDWLLQTGEIDLVIKQLSADSL